MTRRSLLAAMLGALATLTPAAPAHAGPPTPAAPAMSAAPADADSTLDGYLRQLSDSTDTYFGVAAAPLDTAGLDSALVRGLADPRWRPKGPISTSFAPWLMFNRATGPIYGASAAIGRPRTGWEASGSLGLAVGPDPDLWLGSGTLRRTWGRSGDEWEARVGAGRWVQSVDRDAGEEGLSQFRAFFFGSDTRHYLRRDGFEAHLEHRHAAWTAGLIYRDRLESPLPVTTGWYLFGHDLKVPGNLQATSGRSREIEGEVSVPLPFSVRADLDVLVSSPSLGSEFDFTRTRYTVVGDLAPRRWISLVPRVAYGRTLGAMTPQSAHYLGGAFTLRSLVGGSRGGTGMAFGALDALLWKDVLSLFGARPPALLQFQPAVFVAAGALWGEDPYGGPPRPGTLWPEEPAWLPEAGVGLVYRPGLPTPATYFRFDFATGIGQNPEGSTFLFSVYSPLDLLRPRGE
jgi:hypothetical protein